MFLTADCLSVEKREGTLGLLFLTDLRGYDVVLGKLFSTSLRSSYGLVAGFPVLALPLLLGGVTGSAFWRVVLVLLAHVFYLSRADCSCPPLPTKAAAASAERFCFCSLSLRFYRSAPMPSSIRHCRLMWSGCVAGQARRFSCGPRNLRLQQWTAWRNSGHRLASLAAWPSPFWQEGATLPLSWRERAYSGVNRKRRTCRPVGYSNPYLWLATHGQAPLWMVWGLVVLGALISVGLLIDTHISITLGQRPGWTFAASVLSAFGAHQLFKYMVASEASRCFSEDRRNGTMELLMVSPLSPGVIIHGQRRALGSLFRMPAWTLIALNMFLILAHRFAQPYAPQFETWTLVLAGGMALVAADYYGLTWTGMWLGLRSRRHHRAVDGDVAPRHDAILGGGIPLVFWFGPGAV